MRKSLALVFVALIAFVVAPQTAHAKQSRPFPDVTLLPAGFQPEGIASGNGSTFYAGSLVDGDIYRGDLRSGDGSVFIDAPAGRAAVGLKVDGHLLFVAGGATGAAYVYDARTGEPFATYQFASAGSSFLNDVIVTRDGAYFTDSFAPVLYKISLSPNGTPGAGVTIPLDGPAAAIVPGAFNLNGIEASANGSTLIVNHNALGALFTVNPATGESAEIAVDGLTPGAPDGLLLSGRTLWVVENAANRVVGVTLDSGLSSGVITSVLTSSALHTPTTVARHGDRLAVVDARFDLGFPPPFGPGAPPGTEFHVVLLRI
jgi:sugar lactone lactonase YvrE